MFRDKPVNAKAFVLAVTGLLVLAGQSRAQSTGENPPFGYTWNSYPSWQAGQYQHAGRAGMSTVSNPYYGYTWNSYPSWQAGEYQQHFEPYGRAVHNSYYGYNWGGYPSWQAGQYQHPATTGSSAAAYPSYGHNSASIEVRIPANAKLWFDDHLTAQSGADRLFIAPDLQPGSTYHYQVRASWTDSGGNSVTKTRSVSVEAGKRTLVDIASEGAK